MIQPAIDFTTEALNCTSTSYVGVPELSEAIQLALPGLVLILVGSVFVGLTAYDCVCALLDRLAYRLDVARRGSL